MIKRSFRLIILFSMLIMSAESSFAQGLHFSQYYNAPLLLNPANAALMPESDYRAGANYRRQWASIPVPYRTISGYADFQGLRNKNLTNWLGVGLAFFSDKAGDGDLALSRIEGFLAYHVQMGETSMLSAGVSVASVQRSVDFAKLTYPVQWDGFTFNPTLSNQEKGYTAQTNFTDLSVGANFALFPTESFYLKIGLGLAHVNQPKESFFGKVNKIGMRPTLNVDLLVKNSESVIINPSIYYTQEKRSMELIAGTLLQVRVSGEKAETPTQLIFGAYYRVADAVVGTIGLQIDKMRIMSSYDFTLSAMSPNNKGRGAFELGVRYEGFYSDLSRGRQSFNCPRF